MTENLRNLFVETYDLDIPSHQIDPQEPLFGLKSRFGLDSMDTLRFIAVLHQRLGLDIGSTNTETFRTLAQIESVLRNDLALTED